MYPTDTRAAPYIPAHDNDILQVLPHDPQDTALNALRQAYRQNPTNRAIEYQLIDAYINAGRKEADPRYYGYAEALIKPLMAANARPDPALWIEEANVLQYRHDFDAALVLLNKIIRADPRNTQAHLMRAMVDNVRGDFGQARTDCGASMSPAAALTGLTCVAIVDGMTGRLKASYDRLAGYYKLFAPGLSPDAADWTLSALGEMAQRLGDDKTAEADFRAALAANPQDYYTMAAYADLLLARHRPDEVIPLLKDQTQQDNLLVRLALAEDMRHGPDRARYIDLVKARIAAVEMRKEMVHLGDYARFELYVQHDPQTAYKMAKANWAIQKNPQDARILIESAFAAGEPLTGRAILSWQKSVGYEDVSFDGYKKL